MIYNYYSKILFKWSTIIFDVLPFPKIGSWVNVWGNQFVIAFVVFSISIPVKIFQPELIVSIHSVLFLIVIQGVFNKYASFCVPPESVITLFEYLINFIKF